MANDIHIARLIVGVGCGFCCRVFDFLFDYEGVALGLPFWFSYVVALFWLLHFATELDLWPLLLVLAFGVGSWFGHFLRFLRLPLVLGSFRHEIPRWL